MRQFRISMRIEPGADVRDWEGLKDLARSRDEMPRDPMADGDVGAGARILPGPTKVAGESDEGAANEEGNR
jgi:hypothetical protein